MAHVESEFAGAMLVAGDAQIVRTSDIRSEFKGVVSADFGPVIHKLVLVLLLRKGTVALIRPQ